MRVAHEKVLQMRQGGRVVIGDKVNNNAFTSQKDLRAILS